MKIIHTADNHLGAPMLGLSQEAAKLRKEELLGSFLRLLQFAKTEGVDAVFLCGDLFDTPTPSPTLIRGVLEGVAACPAQVFYITGNHDEGVVFPYLPDNFHRFGKGLHSYRLGEITVTGADYRYIGGDFSRLSLPEDTCNFLLLHGDVRQSFSAEKGAIDLSVLPRKNIDYLALGHIHQSSETKRLDGRGAYRYCGTPEGHGFDECGEKGFFLIDTAQGVRSTFIPFATRAYHEILLDLSGVTTTAQAEEKIAAALSGVPSKDGVKLRLKGNVPQGVLRVQKWLASLSTRYFALKIEDETSPALDYEKYESEKSLKGELVRLSSRLPKEEREAVLSLAFRALAGEDLDV